MESKNKTLKVLVIVMASLFVYEKMKCIDMRYLNAVDEEAYEISN